jgi:hypothetical protein
LRQRLEAGKQHEGNHPVRHNCRAGFFVRGVLGVVIADIWNSFRRMPLWVQIWVGFILVPVNMVPLLFLGEPFAIWVAVLSIGGMMPNLPIMLFDRGLSKRMGLPHLLIWTPLVVFVGWLLASDVPLSDGYGLMLAILLVVDLISLGFDYPDALKWWRGDRDIA